MTPHNLFSLITERLMLNCSHITMATYNVLFEVGVVLATCNINMVTYNNRCNGGTDQLVLVHTTWALTSS